MALGTLSIPIGHNGLDVSGAVEVFPAAGGGKLWRKQGTAARTQVTNATFSAWGGTLPALSATVISSSVDFVPGVTFEVEVIDAAGNVSAALTGVVPTVVDAKAPVSPLIGAGGGTFVPQ